MLMIDSTWSRSALRIGQHLLAATLAMALGTCYAATTTLSPGPGLQPALNAAGAGDTILLNAGTYTMANNEPWFHVDKPVTIRAQGGAAIIQAPPSAPFGLQIRVGSTTVEGLTIRGGNFGIAAGSETPGTAISNVTIRRVVIEDAAAGHGIVFGTVTNSLIDSCTITRARENGVFLDAGSNNNLVMNTVVQLAVNQHGFAVKGSDSNTIVGNFVNGAYHGILLIGARFNRVERNTIQGQKYDGITLTPDEQGRQSWNNYVAQNRITANTVRTDGTGIWLNDRSNGTYVFGNTQNGAVEAGVTSFNSSNNYIQGNVLYSNGQAGILLWNAISGVPAPSYNVVHNNFISSTPANADVLIRGANNNNIAYNAFANSYGGVGIIPWQGSGASSGNEVYRNLFYSLTVGSSVDASTTQTRFYRNVFLNAGNSYSIPPADVRWDASNYLGGNFWSDAPGVTPYDRFITNATTGERNKTYKDRFPFADESLGGTYYMAVPAPVALTVAAIDSVKTISWVGKGCTLIDINYASPATGVVSIATNYPNVGYYEWTVGRSGSGAAQNMPPRNDYSIRVDCKKSDGSVVLSGFSPTFTVASSGLRLLSPGSNMIANAGQSVHVGWVATNPADPVNVYFRANNSGWTSLASGVVGSEVDVTIPGSVNSNRVQFRIQSSTNPDLQDTTDRYGTIRGGTPAITGPTGNVIIGETFTSSGVSPIPEIEWISPVGSYYVDLDLWDNDTKIFRPIVTNLPDYSRYSWLVPELFMTGGYIRATFKDASGTKISSVNSAPINLRYSTTAGTLIPFYRLYSDITKEHLFTTDANEYTVLGTRNWAQEGVSGKLLNGPLTVGGVDAVPYYRLYEIGPRQHLWTTDRNEYFTLRDREGWIPEHVVGYVFPRTSAVSGTIPFYRLVWNYYPYHHWTTDSNEYNVLRNRDWTAEGVAAYVYPATATAPSDAPAQPAEISVGPEAFAAAPKAASKSASKDAAPASSSKAGSTAQADPSIEAVLNAASLLRGPIAPGQTISIMGAGLGPVNAVFHDLQKGSVPADLSGARVWIDEIAAPVTFASAREVKAIVPYAVAEKPAVQVSVEYQGVRSTPVKVEIAPAAPGVFTADSSGRGQTVAVNEDMTPNGKENPAKRGSLVLLYATGEGLLDKPVREGEMIGDESVKPKPVTPVSLLVGGARMEVVSATAAPGLPGVLQIAFRLPADLQPGDLPVAVQIGNAASQPGTTLAVQ